jgi:hypothetical protein
VAAKRKDLELRAAELAGVDLPRAGRHLRILGGGLVRGADLSGLRWTSIEIIDEVPEVAGFLPGVLFRRHVVHSVATFEDCDFSGLRCTGFAPGIARFVRCHFDDVRVRCYPVHLRAHFVDCTFSGEFEGNFSGERNQWDPERRPVVRGNDFRRLQGANFFDIPGDLDNHFDEGGEQLVVRRGGRGWSTITARADREEIRWLINGTKGWRAQHWQMYERKNTNPQLWGFLRHHVTGAGTDGTPEPPLPPTRGRLDASADEVPEMTLDVETMVLSGPSLALRAGSERHESDLDAAMLVEVVARLSGREGLQPDDVVTDPLPEFAARALREATEAQLAACADPWSGSGEALPEGFGAWDEAEVLAELRRLSAFARRHPGEPLQIE